MQTIAVTSSGRVHVAGINFDNMGKGTRACIVLLYRRVQRKLAPERIKHLSIGCGYRTLILKFIKRARRPGCIPRKPQTTSNKSSTISVKVSTFSA